MLEMCPDVPDVHFALLIHCDKTVLYMQQSPYGNITSTIVGSF